MFARTHKGTLPSQSIALVGYVAPAASSMGLGFDGLGGAMEGAYRRGILASFVARSPSRVVLAAIAPSLDLLAVSAAVAIVGAINAFGLISIAIIVAAVNTRGRPTARLHPRVADDVGWLLGSVALLMLLVLPLARSSAALDGLVLLGPVAFAFLVVGRTVSYACIRSLRERGTALEPTVIVGAGAVGVEVAFILKAHPEFGLLPIGFLDVPGRDDLPLPLLGDSIDLSDIVRGRGIHRVVVAFGGRPEADLVDILRACDDMPVEIYALPRFFEEGFGSSGAFEDEVWGLPIQRLRRTPFRRVGRYTKRGFDIAVAGAALVLTSPLMAAGAVAVRLSGPGRILFRQTRLGMRGHEFQIFKFRTMIPAESSDTTWYVDDDDRLTRVGRLLRRTSIDELPQLFNVLRGDMSIVGPRPERPHFARLFSKEIPHFDDRVRVPAGVTGWAQVHGRGEVSIQEKVRFDNYYIEHWSLWLDIVTLLRTIKQVVLGAGVEHTGAAPAVASEDLRADRGEGAAAAQRDTLLEGSNG